MDIPSNRLRSVTNVIKKAWMGIGKDSFKLKAKIHIQAALFIRGFVIHGFDYSRSVNCDQNLVFEDISLNYPRISPFKMN